MRISGLAHEVEWLRVSPHRHRERRLACVWRNHLRGRDAIQLSFKPMLLFTIIALCFAATTHAATIERPLANVAQEQRAQAIFHALKCVVCEGQPLSDSDATLAREMRAHVREQLAQGSTEAEILAFFRSRYGDHILMTPPIGPTTYALWLAPLILLLIGGAIVWRSTRPADGGRT